jgi:Ca2+-binding EF-hand superfamily protein
VFAVALTLLTIDTKIPASDAVGTTREMWRALGGTSGRPLHGFVRNHRRGFVYDRLMKHRLFACALVLAAAAGLGAQEPQRPGGPGGPPSPGIALFGALNTERDDALSPAEIDSASAVLKQLDANHDGKLTPDEFPRPAPGGRGPGRGRGGSGGGGEAPAMPTSPDELAAILMAFDKDQDGKLKTSEVPERLQGIFARADADKDGQLTADEIKKAAAAQPAPTGPGRGREGEGRGGPPRRDALFAALDRDGDGTLSADEIAAAPASLRTLDANADGTLMMDEIFAGGRGRG